MASRIHDKQQSAGARRFATTHWSVVVAAGGRPSPESREALAALCRTYWYPLYAYVRRRGYQAEDAEELTQSFFARLLEKKFVGAADRAKGKFRSYLLASLKYFLAKEWRRAGAQKRGGGRSGVSLDFTGGESQYTLEPVHDLTAEKIYERRWALTLIEQTLAKLRDEFASSGEQLRLFERLKPYLGGDKRGAPYRQLGAELGMTEGAVKVAVHRMRRRCREILRAEIAQTVTRPEEVDEELQSLFKAVGR
jgi:RNA polymerase sigma-70 factor (ECF subfamily)